MSLVLFLLSILLNIFPKIPTAEEIARLIRTGIRAEMQDLWWAGAATGFLAGVLLGLFLFSFRKK